MLGAGLAKAGKRVDGVGRVREPDRLEGKSFGGGDGGFGEFGADEGGGFREGKSMREWLVSGTYGRDVNDLLTYLTNLMAFGTRQWPLEGAISVKE